MRAKEPTEEIFFTDDTELYKAVEEEKSRGGLNYVSVAESVMITNLYREQAAQIPATDALLKAIEAAFLLGYHRGRAEK